jgi:hypothetical protein
MPAYFIEAKIGGTTLVKVEAPNLEHAKLIAAMRVLDDWENAGALKLKDVRVNEIEVEASIAALDDAYEMTADDPNEVISREIEARMDR